MEDKRQKQDSDVVVERRDAFVGEDEEQVEEDDERRA